MIYKQRSFLISSNTVQMSSESMNFIPLTIKVLTLIFSIVVGLSVLVGFYHVFTTMEQYKSIKSVILVFLDQTRTTMWKMYMVLLKQPVGLKKWNKSVATTLLLFCWFFAALIMAGMYDAVVRTELMPRLSLPFHDSMGLASLIRSGERKMITEDPQAPFYSLIETADTPHYIALREALISTPTRIVGSQEVISTLKEGSNYVYAANTVAAKFIMKQDCDLVEIPDKLAEFSGLVLAFPKNSTLGEEFRETILQLHSTVSRIVNEAGSNRCLQSGVQVSPLPLPYLTMVFVTCAVGLMLAGGVFMLELSWCKKQMAKNEFLSTVRDAVLMEEEHQEKSHKVEFIQQLNIPSRGMYANLKSQDLEDEMQPN